MSKPNLKLTLWEKILMGLLIVLAAIMLAGIASGCDNTDAQWEEKFNDLQSRFELQSDSLSNTTLLLNEQGILIDSLGNRALFFAEGYDSLQTELSIAAFTCNERIRDTVSFWITYIDSTVNQAIIRNNGDLQDYLEALQNYGN